MAELYDNRTSQYLGRIPEKELKFLVDNLQEESLTDKNYYVDRPALALLKEKEMSEGSAKLVESTKGENNKIKRLMKKFKKR